MYDILDCEADPKKFGFDGFYFINLIRHEGKGNKIIRAANAAEAANFKNRKVLVMLDDYAFDEGAIKLFAEKKQACFLIDLSRILNSSGVSRAILFSKLATFLRMCNRFGAFYSFATFSDNESKIRTPEELVYIAMLFGINRGQAKFALKMLKHYL